MQIEPLESRIAPAVLIVNPTTATYTDLDGDLVTIKVSTGAFNNTHFTTQMIGAGEQLLLINLSAGGFDDAHLTLSVVKAGAGDGRANVGAINSTGHDLGHVFIPGDLGQIDAGDTTTADGAVKSLTVRSMGRYGLTTQQAGGSLTSDLVGGLGALTVAGDMKEASVVVTATVDADAKIGSVTIGGSLIGGAATMSGMISAEGNIGPVKIGGEFEGGDSRESGLPHEHGRQDRCDHHRWLAARGFGAFERGDPRQRHDRRCEDRRRYHRRWRFAGRRHLCRPRRRWHGRLDHRRIDLRWRC